MSNASASALPVEVPGRDDLERIVEDDRVVGDGVQVDLDEPREERERLAGRAVDLRDAAERVGVLDVSLARPEPLRARVERPDDRGRPGLARQRAKRVDARVERGRLAAERLERERGDARRRVSSRRLAPHGEQASRSRP